MPSWKKVITSGSDAALNSLNVTTSLTASGNIYPTGLGVDRQILKTNGAGNISFGYAEEIVAIVKNVSGGTLQKGTPVHATASGAMGNVVGIIAASASDASTMPATFVLNETLNDGDEGEALSAGFIQGVNTAAFEVGQIIYVGESGGYTGTKPTGSNLIQNLGIVTKVGLTNGAGYVLGAGRSNDLPNIQPGYVWVGNSNSVPTPTATSSIQNVVSASFATSASWAPGGGATFPYTGSAEITGSLGVTGSFSVLDSIDATNKILIGSGPIPGSTEDSVNWDSRTLLDSNGNFSVRWGALRTMFDASQVDSINWDARILKDALGNDSGQWGTRRLISTNTSRSIDWENRSLHDFSGNITVEWTSTALYDVSAKNALNWDARDAYDSAEIPAINWDARRLIDSSAVAAVRWDLRSAYDTVDSQSIDWSNRLLKIDNGPASYTVNWNTGILRDTNAKNSIDWQNRIAIDTANKDSINWQNRQLKDSNGTEIVNWTSGVSITGSATVSGSLTVTGSLLITGSSTLINQGPTILSGSFKVQGEGDGFGGPITTAITVDDINFTRKLHDSQTGSGSLDFANRDLLDANGNGAFNWNGVAATIDSRLYINQTVSAAVRDKLLTNVGTAGQLLNDVAFDSTVQINDLVYLGNDGSWYQVDQATDSSTRMLGICMSYDPMTYIGQVLLEGDVIVSTGPGYPSVAGAGYGTPVYIKEGAGTAMSTTVPVNDYVRLLGYCYHEAGGTEWIMKFRPSNEWIEL